MADLRDGVLLGALLALAMVVGLGPMVISIEFFPHMEWLFFPCLLWIAFVGPIAGSILCKVKPKKDALR